MFKGIKEQLFTNWHPMRWVALIFGVGLFYNWLVNTAPVSGFLALFFLFQAITNTGCVAGQCATPAYQAVDDTEPARSVEFEEIKNEKQ